eukprot:991440-Amphidinium_carterae.1
MATRIASAMRRLRRRLRCSSDSLVVVGSMTSTANKESVATFVSPPLPEAVRLPSGASSRSGSPDGELGDTLTSPCGEE